MMKTWLSLSPLDNILIIVGDGGLKSGHVLKTSLEGPSIRLM